jgi:hypothetical protein
MPALQLSELWYKINNISSKSADNNNATDLRNSLQEQLLLGSDPLINNY